MHSEAKEEMGSDDTQGQVAAGLSDGEHRAELDALRAEYERKVEALERQAGEDRAARVQAERLAALSGKVADARAALRLIDERHLREGEVDISALVAEYPILALRPQTLALDGPNPVGGGVVGLERAVRSGDAAAINAAMDAILGGRGEG